MTIELEAYAALTKSGYEEVQHPQHYNQGKVEVWDMVEDLSFNLGNVVKYVCRAGHKPGVDILTDLRKAQAYLDREIKRIEGTQNVNPASQVYGGQPSS